MTDQPDTNDPDVIQHRICQARTGLLGGRGPGANPDEIARWQRDRPMLGAQPAAAARQQLADQAILARGNPDELQHLIACHRAGLAALAGQLHERRARASAVIRIAGPAALAGAMAGAAATTAARTALRAGRRRRYPRLRADSK